MLAEGLTNAEIADQLLVTNHTAEKYVSELKAWFGARDRVDLVLRCIAEVGEQAP
jgi:DNA-binding NarL/FixJ family response regulator